MRASLVTVFATLLFAAAACGFALAEPAESQEVPVFGDAAVVDGMAVPLSGDVLEQDVPALALAHTLLANMEATAPLARMSLEANVANIASMREEGYYESSMASFDALTWGNREVRALVLPFGFSELLSFIEFNNPGIGADNARAVAEVQDPMRTADPTFFATRLFNITSSTFEDQMLQMATVSAISSIQGPLYFSAPVESWTDRAVLLFVGEEGAEEALVVCGFAPAGVGSAGMARASWLPAQTAAWVQQNLGWLLDAGTWYSKEQIGEACGAWKPSRFMLPTRLIDDTEAYLLNIARERGAAIAQNLDFVTFDFWNPGCVLSLDELQEIALVAAAPGNTSFFALPEVETLLDGIEAAYPGQVTTAEQRDALVAMGAANPAGLYDALVVGPLCRAGWYGDTTEGYVARQEAALVVDTCLDMAGAPGVYGLPEGWTQDAVLVEISVDSSFAIVTVFAQAPGRVLSVETHAVRLNTYGGGCTAGDFLHTQGCTDGTPYGVAVSV